MSCNLKAADNLMHDVPILDLVEWIVSIVNEQLGCGSFASRNDDLWGSDTYWKYYITRPWVKQWRFHNANLLHTYYTYPRLRGPPDFVTSSFGTWCSILRCFRDLWQGMNTASTQFPHSWPSIEQAFLSYLLPLLLPQWTHQALLRENLFLIWTKPIIIDSAFS